MPYAPLSCGSFIPVLLTAPPPVVWGIGDVPAEGPGGPGWSGGGVQGVGHVWHLEGEQDGGGRLPCTPWAACGEGLVERRCCAEEKGLGEMDRRIVHKRHDC